MYQGQSETTTQSCSTKNDECTTQPCESFWLIQKGNFNTDTQGSNISTVAKKQKAKVWLNM